MISFPYFLIVTIVAWPLTLPVEAVTFATASANVSVSFDHATIACYVNASSLAIDSIDTNDILSFPSKCQQACLAVYPNECSPVTLKFDLSYNRLSFLPTGLGDAFASTQIPLILSVILAWNKFNATSIGNFFPTSPSSSDATVFGTASNKGAFRIDLTGNQLGPNLPTSFRTFYTSLTLQSCGISNIQPFALNGSLTWALDLSYNDLRTGLHALSFYGAFQRGGTLILSNANLRSESLPAGLFHTAGSGSIHLILANQDLTTEAAAKQTAVSYLATMPNVFANLTNVAFNVPPQGSKLSQLVLSSISIGDLVSMATATFFAGNASWSYASFAPVPMTINLASSIAASSVGIAKLSYCPGPTIARALSFGTRFGTSLSFAITVDGFNLPAPPLCQYPDPTGFRWSLFSLTVPIEPPFLQRSFTVWLAASPLFSNDQSSGLPMLSWAPPAYDIWNPILNVSDWVDVQLLKGIVVTSFTLPALPLQFAFPAPDGMFAFLEPSLSAQIFLTQSLRFTPGMLSGRQVGVGILPLSFLTLPSRLYQGYDPVPLDFFTPIQGSTTILVFECYATSNSDCSQASANFKSQCPHIVNQVCLPCPDGWFPSVYISQPSLISGGLASWAYCQRCPSGSRCVSAESTRPIPCYAGYYQPLEAQSQCTPCSYGTFNPLTGSASPAACVQCSPGRYNPTLAGANETACIECPIGRASSIPGVAACNECSAGSYQNLTGQFSCIPCPRNSYLDQPGAVLSDQCQACPDDSPLSPPGSGSVLSCSTGVVCEDGYYTQVRDSKPCQSLCPVGCSCQSGKATPCEAGSYSNSTGAKKCTPCGVGMFGSSTGSSSVLDCTPCPRSMYSIVPTSAYCSACTAGTTSSITGASDAIGCVATTSKCFIPMDLSSNALTSTSQYCPLSAVEPISLTPMLDAGIQTMQRFYAGLPGTIGFNAKRDKDSSTINQAAFATLSSDDSANSTSISNQYRRYPTVRSAPSLRIAAFGSDATLDQWQANEPFADTNIISAGTTASVLASTQTIVIFIVLCTAAVASWPIYRLIPATVAWHVDQFSTSHSIPDQGSVIKQRTQFGSAMTWSFLCVSVLVAILLGTAPNTIVSTALVPPSSLPSAGQAKAQFQFTIRAYSNAESVASYCDNVANSGLDITQEGFTSTFVSRILPRGQVCAVAADCFDCGLSTGASSIVLSFPYSVQLVEWEIWVSAAATGTWTRRYGVLSQLPDTFMSASSQLEFSAIEAYHEDHSRRGDGQVKSGFEIDFLRYTSVIPQPKLTYNSDSKVQLAFVLQKSDIMFTSTVANKLSMIQLLVSIVTSIVSLFTIFVILFRKVEQLGLQGLLKASSGLVVKDQQTGNIVVKKQLDQVLPSQNSLDCQACGGRNDASTQIHPVTIVSSRSSIAGESWQANPALNKGVSDEHQKLAKGYSPSDVETSTDPDAIGTQRPIQRRISTDFSSTEMTRL